MRNTYFYQLYQYDRKLFFLTASFTLLTIFFNIRGNEITPFFVWGMYSEREKPIDRYEIFNIKINGNIIIDYTSGYTDANRFFLFSPLSYYKKIKENNSIDPTLDFLQKKLGYRYKSIKQLAEKINNGPREEKMFMNWYKRYLQETTGQQINKLEVNVLTGHFMNRQRIYIDSSYLLEQWTQH